MKSKSFDVRVTDSTMVGLSIEKEDNRFIVRRYKLYGGIDNWDGAYDEDWDAEWEYASFNDAEKRYEKELRYILKIVIKEHEEDIRHLQRRVSYARQILHGIV